MRITSIDIFPTTLYKIVIIIALILYKGTEELRDEVSHLKLDIGKFVPQVL